MSEIKVNKLSPRTNCGTVQLGDSGDTITIPAGATITNNGTAAGFGATGAASWDTTVKTSGFTAVSGVGYFVNTTSGAITVTLPASPDAGAVVAVSDYAQTANTNNITLARNGSNIQGDASDLVISRNGVAMTLVYVDATKGWIVTDTGAELDKEADPEFIAATGGTITTSGDYKIHTFTGPGTFTVCSAGNSAGSNSVDYLVVAGGAGGSFGGGGAGGYRESSGAASGCYAASPLGACVSALPVTATGYPITVGGGGAGRPSNANGSSSIFSTITSNGGGTGGGASTNNGPGIAGGSGGGGGHGPGSPINAQPGGAGNTPPTSPAQGAAGGTGYQSGCYFGGGGGGGATVAGTNGVGGAGPVSNTGGNGGTGATTSINGTPTVFAGGGGGAYYYNTCAGQAGAGGGGRAGIAGGGSDGSAAGTTNTGGGGGGGNGTGKAGGSGIVIIRYKFQ
jgi:hypothetical protein